MAGLISFLERVLNCVEFGLGLHFVPRLGTLSDEPPLIYKSQDKTTLAIMIVGSVRIDLTL